MSKSKTKNTTWDKNQAEKALQCLDNSESFLRKKAMVFDLKQGWKILGYEKCMDCLKDRLKNVSASTIYRYIQAGKVEEELELEIGSQVMSSMLEISKYAKDDWEYIWDEIEEERPSVAMVKAAINLLIKDGDIEPLAKNERTDKSIAVRMEKIKEELKIFDIKSLETLNNLITNQIELLGTMKVRMTKF